MRLNRSFISTLSIQVTDNRVCTIARGSVCLRRLWLTFRRNNKRAQVLFHRNESLGSQALDSARS